MCVVFSLIPLTAVQAARYLPQFNRLHTLTSIRLFANNHTAVEVRTETVSNVRLLQVAEDFFRACGAEGLVPNAVANVVPIMPELESAYLRANVPVFLALVRPDGPLACPDGDGVDVVVQRIIELAPGAQWPLGKNIGINTHLKIRIPGIDAQGRLV